MNVTDDRQTDGRTIAYSEREREFTFAKTVRVSLDHPARCRSSLVVYSAIVFPLFIRIYVFYGRPME